MEPILCCGNCSRTCAASGSSLTVRPEAIHKRASNWPLPWSVARVTVSRWRRPVARQLLASRRTDSGTPSNRFNFDSDVDASRCPFGAHIRRSNPRNADFPEGTTGFFSKLAHDLGFKHVELREDIMSSTRFHRLLRRGREYGPGLSPEQALQPDYPDNAGHGLHFVCLNANISRQFEFVQSAWIMNSKFNGITGETDPLLGNRLPIANGQPTDSFLIPQESGLACRISGLPQFITVRGGAYFFLPGIKALKFLATAYASK